jgi:hypothetical protein
MRPLILAIAVTVLPVACAAQETGIVAIARSASRIQLIQDTCGRFFRIDKDRADAYRLAFLEIGNKSHGEAAFAKALREELPRRRQEVAAAGPKSWCAGQRDRLRDIGIRDIFLDRS